MPKGSLSHKEARKEEIINACLELFEDLNFKDITIKDIAEYTSFSRPSIYNYFETKEEIFLAIFQKEYEYWTEDLNKIAKSKKAFTIKTFANNLAKSLVKRILLLKLLSINLFDMENHSRIECLVEFKKAYGSSMQSLANALKHAFPDFNKKRIDKFIYAFMPFMNGIYPYAYASEEQIEAMEKAKVKFNNYSVYELANNIILSLLGD